MRIKPGASPEERKAAIDEYMKRKKIKRMGNEWTTDPKFQYYCQPKKDERYVAQKKKAGKLRSMSYKTWDEL